MKIKQILNYSISSLLLVLGHYAQAETAYVNDRIFLGVYAEAKMEGKAIYTLQSGAILEVLERTDGFARIQTETGQVGWVRESFIVAEKPPSLRIKDVEAERDKLQASVNAMPAGDDFIVVRNDLAKAEQQVKELKALLAEQMAASKDLEKYTAADKKTVPVTKDEKDQIAKRWKERIMVASVFLLLGLAGGIAWMGQRIRKRFGGYKVW